jgi:hypothetical protein
MVAIDDGKRHLDDPDFAEVEGAPATPLKIEAGKIYVDADGFLHGPMKKRNLDEAFDFHDGFLTFRSDGSCPLGNSIRLVAEWIPPVPHHAAEENERLRQEVEQLQTRIDVFDGLSRSDANHLAKRLGVEKVGPNRHRSTVFHECLQSVDRLRQVAEHQRQEIGKLHSQIDRLKHGSACRSDFAPLCDALSIIRPLPHESIEDVVNRLVSTASRLKHDVEMWRDRANDILADMQRAESRLDALCVPHDSYFDGSVTAVFVPKEKLEEFSASCSDLACWMQGFTTALPPDDRLIFMPLGQYVITELNILLKAAIDRVEAAEKMS